MNQRLYDRLSATLSVAILAVLAAVSYYLAEFAAQMRLPERAGAVGHEPDYFVDRLAMTRLNRRGEPVYRMSADRLLHYPDDDTHEFQDPVLVSLEPGKPLVTLRASRGRSTGGGERTDLYGDVVLTRAPDAGKPALRVETDHAVLLSSEDVARSDRPVRIQYGESSLTGVGMEFNNSTRVLNVLSDVRGVWTAPSRR